MANPIDTFAEPFKEVLEDRSLVLKVSNGCVLFRFFSQIATFILGLLTYVKNPETGEKALDVAPETEENYRKVAGQNLAGLPQDATYAVLLNFAKDGNTKAVAQKKATQIVAIGNLVLDAIGSVVATLLTIGLQLVKLITDIMGIDMAGLDFEH